MQSIGGSLTRWVSLPLIAAGAASVIYAYKYESSMMKVAGINRQSTKDMAIYRKGMDSLAQTTGRGPAELADALYFVTSTGFKGAGAMKILQASAKGAAMGMGETQVVADSLTTALAAYEGTGLTAARAMDILTAAIRTGKAEPAEFAARIGDVAANAAHLGVEFADVAASIAVMTAKGIKTPEAVTSINNLMLGLTKGTKAGADYLASMGSSYYDLRKILASQGIVPALKEIVRLSDKAGPKKADEILKTIIPNIRSLRAVWGLLGGTGARLKKTFDEVKNSSGEAAGTFKIWAATDVGKLQMAWAAFLVGLKDLGTILLPGVTAIMQKLAGIGKAFSSLSGPQKSFLVKMGLIAAIVGPAIWVLGTLVSSIGTLAIALSKAGLAMKTFAVASGAIKAAFIGGAAFAPQSLASVAAATAASGLPTRALIPTMGATEVAGETAAIAGLSKTEGALNRVSRAAGGARAGFAAVGSAILGILGPIGITIAAIAGIGLAIYSLYRLSKAFSGAKSSAADYKGVTARLKSPDASAFQAQMDKALGGHYVVKAGTLVWQPKNVDVSSETIVAAVHAAAAKLRAAKAEEAQEDLIAAAKIRFDELDNKAKFAEQNARMAANKTPAIANAAADTAEAARAAADQAAGVIDKLSGSLDKLVHHDHVIMVKAQISDLQTGVKKAQTQLDALTKKPHQTSVIIHQELGLEKKIADMKAALKTLTGKNWKILLEAKIQAAQSNLKTLRGDLTKLNNKKTSPKIEAQKQLLEAAIKKAHALLVKLNGEKANPKITANTSQAQAAINQVIASLRGVQSKTITLTTRETIVRAKHALGGVFRTPHVAQIAEEGPEAVIPLDHPVRAAQIMRQAGLSADDATGRTTNANPVGKTVAVATKAANSVAGAIGKATGGLGKKKLARLSNAADASGSIQTLIDFISSIGEALNNLDKVTVPALSSQWKAKIKAIVRQAAKVAIVIAQEINKAFPWTKGRPKTKKQEAVDPKMGKKGTKLSQAGEAGGPIGDLLDFVSGISELLTTISTAVIPAASADALAKARALAKAAAEMAKAVAAELIKVFPATTTTRVNKGTKRKPKWKKITARGEAAANLEGAGALAGPIGDVLGVVTNMSELLTAITAQTVAMTPELLTKARDMAKAAADVAKAVSEELIKAFPKATSTKVNTGTKKKPKWALVTAGGESLAALEDAGPLAGPVADMLGLITGISDTLTMLTTTAVPAMTAAVAQKARTLAQAAVQIAQIVQEEVNKVFSSEASKTGLASTAATAGPLGEVLGVAGSALDLLKSMTEVDPRLFEPPAGAFARLGAIIKTMAATFVADLSGIVIPDSVMTAIDRLKLLADALLSVLDVMRGVSEVDAGNFGTAGWTNIIGAANGMVNAASALGIGNDLSIAGVSQSTASAGSVAIGDGRGSETAAGDTYVKVYLNSTEIAAQIEIQKQHQNRVDHRTRGGKTR